MAAAARQAWACLKRSVYRQLAYLHPEGKLLDTSIGIGDVHDPDVTLCKHLSMHLDAAFRGILHCWDRAEAARLLYGQPRVTKRMITPEPFAKKPYFHGAQLLDIPSTRYGGDRDDLPTRGFFIAPGVSARDPPRDHRPLAAACMTPAICNAARY